MTNGRMARLIRAVGPIPVARYMAEALGDPDTGYYMTRDPIGRDGDFITAPEVSQMFGELVGLWTGDLWQRLGAPGARLVEVGPGHGTLMRDALRALAVVPGMATRVDVHLVETSPTLRARQQETLATLRTEAGGPWSIRWHERLADVPGGPLLLVANELFDALPIHQFVRTVDGWRERLVDLSTTSPGFRFVLGPPSAALAAVPEPVRAAPPGAVAETCPSGISLMADIATRIAAAGGGALIIDYGHDDSRAQDTLQAVRRHGRHDVLDAPGTADLCAYVDFAVLARVATEAGARPWGPVTQGAFLEALGISARAERLSRGATARQAAEIAAAHARLTDPAQMGTLFKVLAVVPENIAPPAGFDGPAGTAPGTTPTDPAAGTDRTG
jgi:NADH dehydrogenase [ubiquinone] 1 alpha subcomplex assembly factor 7